MQFRGAYAPKPPQPRQLSEKALIESGQKSDPSTRRSHADDKPLVSMAETAKMAEAMLRKKHGLPSEEEHFKSKAEQISVNRLGKLDHGKTRMLRETFVYKDTGKTTVDWRQTWELRDRLATQIEKEKNR
jgi:hypothetical protein